MALRVRSNLVAIAPLEDPDKSPGGIIIPDSAKQKLDQGIVIYKGHKVTEVKIGDHVLFNGYAGTHLAVEGEGFFIIMSELAVAAVVTDSNNWVFTDQMLDEAMVQAADLVFGTTALLNAIECKAVVRDYNEKLELVLKQMYAQKGLMF